MLKTSELAVLYQPSDDCYMYRLGVSSDTLVVISLDGELMETICDGDDPDGILCECLDEDHFLDCIQGIKLLISRGIDPTLQILNNHIL